MKKSFNNPSIASTIYVPKKIPRNVSVPVSLGQIMNDIYIEYQAECATHTLGYMAGICHYQHKFPLDLLNSGEEDDEAARTIAACIACPPDGECTKSYEEDEESGLQRRLQFMLRNDMRKKSIENKRG